MCVRERTHRNMSVELRGQQVSALPSILSETGSFIVCHGVRQANWPMGFWEVSCLHLLLLCGKTGLAEACTTDCIRPHIWPTELPPQPQPKPSPNAEVPLAMHLCAQDKILASAFKKKKKTYLEFSRQVYVSISAPPAEPYFSSSPSSWKPSNYHKGVWGYSIAHDRTGHGCCSWKGRKKIRWSLVSGDRNHQATWSNHNESRKIRAEDVYTDFMLET